MSFYATGEHNKKNRQLKKVKKSKIRKYSNVNVQKQQLEVAVL